MRYFSYSMFFNPSNRPHQVLYVMLCGRFPFKANHEHELYHRIRRGTFALNDVFISSTAKRVIRGILRVDGSLRPTVAQIIQHEWVCGMSKQVGDVFWQIIQNGSAG